MLLSSKFLPLVVLKQQQLKLSFNLLFLYSHGGGKVFSSRGIQQAVKFFEDKGHIDVKVIVPEKRLMRSRSDVFVQDPKILQDLKEKGILETVKDDIYDDKNILTNAVHSFAVIISNDKFNDDQFKKMPEILNYLKEDK